jgi:archaellum biogenesis ATPase FlaH
MTIVMEDRWFQKPNGTYRRQGFFLDPTLKYNFDNYLIRGVKHGHDGIVLITGLEGTGKSTFTQALAAYCDCKQTLD